MKTLFGVHAQVSFGFRFFAKNVIFQNLAFYIDGSSILRGQGLFLVFVFAIFWCLFGASFLNFLLKILSLICKLQYFLGLARFKCILKKLIFRSKNDKHKLKQTLIFSSFFES